MDHYKNPRNEGKLEGATYTCEEHNPLCGDKQTWYVIIENEIISKVKYIGEGCAISLASASMLSEKIQNMRITDVQNLTENDMMDLLGTKVNPGRLKCLMLPLSTIKKAIKD